MLWSIGAIQFLVLPVLQAVEWKESNEKLPNFRRFCINSYMNPALPKYSFSHQNYDGLSDTLIHAITLPSFASHVGQRAVSSFIQ